MHANLPLRLSRAGLALQWPAHIHRAGRSLANLHTQSPEGARSGKKKRAPGWDKSTQQLFHAEHSRHMLRGILRELTYFPDRAAAEYLCQHALRSFAEYSHKVWEHRNDEAYEERLQTMRRKGRQAMYQLQRANQGDRKMMMKALHMAYGRSGKRRRELMRSLLPLPEPEPEPTPTSDRNPECVDETETETDISATTADAEYPVKAQTKAFIASLPPQLHALILSQISASPPTLTRRNPKRLSIAIPELNTWYKPMPQSRVRNKIKEWYAKTLDTLLPPLPDNEYERLRHLATGKTRFEGMRPRRKKLAPEMTALEMVVLKGKVPESMLGRKTVKRITPRFMREAWRDVFSQCPRMEYELETERWKVTWGHHELAGETNSSVAEEDLESAVEDAVLEEFEDDDGESAVPRKRGSRSNVDFG